MKFLKAVHNCTRQDRLWNKGIRPKLNLYKIKLKKKNWEKHVNKMEDRRTPKKVMLYKPKKRRVLEHQKNDGRAL